MRWGSGDIAFLLLWLAIAVAFTWHSIRFVKRRDERYFSYGFKEFDQKEWPNWHRFLIGWHILTAAMGVLFVAIGCWGLLWALGLID